MIYSRKFVWSERQISHQLCMILDHPIQDQTNQDRRLHIRSKIAPTRRNCSNMEFKKKDCSEKYRLASKLSRYYSRKKRISNNPIELRINRKTLYLSWRSSNTGPKLKQRTTSRPRRILNLSKMREPI